MGSPWHVHRDEDEVVDVQEGECEVYIGDAHLTRTAGGFAFGPKGVPHTFFGGPNGGKMRGAGGSEVEGTSQRRSLSPLPSTFCRRRPGSTDMDLLLPIADKWAYDIVGPPVSPPG